MGGKKYEINTPNLASVIYFDQPLDRLLDEVER